MVSTNIFIILLLIVPCNTAQLHLLEKTIRFREIILECNPALIELMDTSTLLPYLQREKLLTQAECEVLTCLSKTRTEKIRFLLSVLPTKGQHSFELFVRCLEEANEHKGHQELATLLKSTDSESVTTSTATLV